MPRLAHSRLLMFAALPLLALPAFTQNEPQAASPAAPATAPTANTPSTRLFEIIHSDTGYLTGPEGSRTVVLSGRVHVKQGDTHFYADRITFNQGTKKGQATRDPKLKNSIGNPVAQDESHHLTADRMMLDFSSTDARKKYVSALGHVRFTAKPDPANKPSPPSDPKKDEILPRRVKEETVLTCDKLDYFYRTRRAVAESNLKVVQGKRWLTGDQAIYYKRDETVVVNGNVKGEDEKGRTFAADNLKVLLSGETETIQASKFTGTFLLEDEEETPVDGGPASAEERPPVFPGSDEAEEAAPASPAPSAPADSPSPPTTP